MTSYRERHLAGFHDPDEAVRSKAAGKLDKQLKAGAKEAEAAAQAQADEQAAASKENDKQWAAISKSRA